MDRPGYSEEAQKAHEAALLDVGNKLANPPSSVDELLSLLTRAEFLLFHAHQICTCKKVIWSVQDAIRPAMHALISDKIFKHHCLDVKVAVASCINEIVRITISEYPYTDAQMKEIFGLFMVAFKQLSCGSSTNCERALHILATMAELKTCLIMLDLDVEMNTMVVEMFQLFLDMIRPHHSTDMFTHMQKIMILIVQEDQISVELLRTLLSSVRMDNRNTSPRSWELGKSVIENCATILQQHVREAVKAMNLDVADYAQIVASLIQDTSSGNDTVGNKEVENIQVTNEECGQVANEGIEEAGSLHVASEEATTVNEEGKTVQFIRTDASGDGVSKLDERSQAGPEMQLPAERRRREIKPNTLRRPDEGYQHDWLGGGRGSSKKERGSVKKGSIQKRDRSKNKKSMMNQDYAQGVLDKQKKTTKGVVEKEKVNHSASKLGDVMNKEVAKHKVEGKGSNGGKKTTEGVVRCRTLSADNEKFSEDKGNKTISKKHESENVVDKVVESTISTPAKHNLSEIKEKGSKKRKKASKCVVVQSDAQKEKVVESPIPVKAEYPGELDSEKETEPLVFRPEYGRELVNMRIMVWWPIDETFYTGTIESYDPVTKKHKIKYDDGEEESLDLSEEIWEMSKEAQPSNEREADPSPVKEPVKTQKKTTKRMAGSSKKECVGSSSKRSKSEGKSGHSALESIPLNAASDDDDELSEAKFSWKARAMGRADKQKSNTSRRKRKGKPSRGTSNDIKNG